jgi:hypothetical protein
MANLTKIQSQDILSLFPTYGTQPTSPMLPIWNEDDKIFMTTRFQSKAGHYYYAGLRFSSQLAIVEKVSLWNTWKYIDTVEVYMFNGKERQLIGSKKFNKEFYHLDVIKEAVYNLVGDFVQSQSKLAGKEINVQVVKQTVQDMVERCYKSFLDDDYAIQLNNLLPLLDVKRIGE